MLLSTTFAALASMFSFECADLWLNDRALLICKFPEFGAKIPKFRDPISGGTGLELDSGAPQLSDHVDQSDLGRAACIN